MDGRGAIAAAIALNIAVALASPREGDVKDQRDKEIGRLGDHAGQSFLVIGAVGALALSMAEADHFWISNVIYLGFVLSALLGSAVKLAAYRWGSSRGEGDRHHEPDPGPALRTRGDDAGGAGGTRRRDPADRHRDREGPLLALLETAFRIARVFAVPLEQVFQYTDEQYTNEEGTAP